MSRPTAPLEDPQDKPTSVFEDVCYALVVAMLGGASVASLAMLAGILYGKINGAG